MKKERIARAGNSTPVYRHPSWQIEPEIHPQLDYLAEQIAKAEANILEALLARVSLYCGLSGGESWEFSQYEGPLVIDGVSRPVVFSLAPDGHITRTRWSEEYQTYIGFRRKIGPRDIDPWALVGLASNLQRDIDSLSAHTTKP